MSWMSARRPDLPAGWARKGHRTRLDTLIDVPSPCVAIEGSDPIRMRTASALAGDHRIDRIGLLGRKPPASWGPRVTAITSAAGWDLCVGIDQPGATEVTVGPGDGVSWAGPTGLARCLGVRIGTDALLAGTVPGDPIDTDPRFGFPPPLGWLGSELEDGIHHCPTPGSVAAVMAVTSDGRSLVVLDERAFLDGALLAAGVLLAAEGHRGPVWDAPSRYLDLIADFGLVLAEAAA